VTYGRTLAEAKNISKDALSDWIESLKKRGQPTPADPEWLVGSLEIAETSRRHTAGTHPALQTKGFVVDHFSASHSID
jgi:hypothetical protein